MAGELYASPRKALLKALVMAVAVLTALYFAETLLPVGKDVALYIAGALLLIIAIYALYHYVQARHRVIFLHDSHLQYRRGVLNVETINIPYAKVDNVRTAQTLSDRLLGLIRVEIDTPGEKIVEIVFPDADAKAFKPFYEALHKKLEEVKGSGGL